MLKFCFLWQIVVIQAAPEQWTFGCTLITLLGNESVWITPLWFLLQVVLELKIIKILKIDIGFLASIDILVLKLRRWRTFLRMIKLTLSGRSRSTSFITSLVRKQIFLSLKRYGYPINLSEFWASKSHRTWILLISLPLSSPKVNIFNITAIKS
jgi:hypothetical protein